MDEFVKEKIDITKLLEEGQAVQFKPQGYSMYPVIVPGRDQALVEPLAGHKLKRGDVVLYRRPESILVIHRILRVKPEGLYLVGDNQIEVEGPLSPECVKGIMTYLIRRGRKISVKNPIYRLITGTWLAMRPVRMIIMRPLAKLKKFFRKGK